MHHEHRQTVRIASFSRHTNIPGGFMPDQHPRELAMRFLLAQFPSFLTIRPAYERLYGGMTADAIEQYLEQFRSALEAGVFLQLQSDALTSSYTPVLESATPAT